MAQSQSKPVQLAYQCKRCAGIRRTTAPQGVHIQWFGLCYMCDMAVNNILAGFVPRGYVDRPDVKRKRQACCMEAQSRSNKVTKPFTPREEIATYEEFEKLFLNYEIEVAPSGRALRLKAR